MNWMIRYTRCLERIGADWRDWLVFFALIGFVVPIALMTIYMATSSHLQQTPFYLSYSAPTIESIYLSSFGHHPFIHLWSNIFIFEDILLMIMAWVFIGLPVLANRHRGAVVRFRIETLWYVTVLAFIVSPFVIGGISVVFGNLFGVNGGYGFSGIIYIYMGYLMVLVQQAAKEKHRILMYTRPWIAWGGQLVEEMVFVMPFFVIVLESLMMPGSNILGHCLGYLMGWFGTKLIDTGTIKKEID